MYRQIEIEVGKSYKRGSYEASGEIVTVKAIDLDRRQSYDDHQGGYHMSKGEVEFIYTCEMDGKKYADCQSLEYAKDYWTEA